MNKETKIPYENLEPSPTVESMSWLRARMTAHNSNGGRFLDYLLEGDFFDGKGVWINSDAQTKMLYERVIAANPLLASESPYGTWFNQHKVRGPGENHVHFSHISQASSVDYEEHCRHVDEVKSGRKKEHVVFAGGPAAKIAAILAQKQPDVAKTANVMFFLDGGEQSNESASASYEHINHANALNAEHDNSGLAILLLALKRVIFKETDPTVALDVDYRKVDLWPRAIALRDFPIYVQNEIHGLSQKLKTIFGLMNDHDKSRIASRKSTQILSYIESELGIELRMAADVPRSFFLYLTNKEHTNSFKDHDILKRFVQLEVEKVDASVLTQYYGDISNIVSCDLIRENHCIRHGFDFICSAALKQLGGKTLNRVLLEAVYFDGIEKSHRCVGIKLMDLSSGQRKYLPVDKLGLSLGPTATYGFATERSSVANLLALFGARQPVPHQTIATGFSGQLLFRIKDHKRFRHMPHTGLKQTHFVEIGRVDDLLVLKLTSGGNIGLPVYSRSYPIGALANMFRVLSEDCGLEFIDVVSAIPGIRGVNGPNNGQIVRIADNCAIRFGEGGTGMSKMGTNAQTLLEMIGLQHGLPIEIELSQSLYRHTILDRRKIVASRTSKATR